MKFRKVVSLFAAAAMAVSSFTGLATTASAADVSKTIDNASVGTIYKASDLYGGDLSEITAFSPDESATGIVTAENFGELTPENYGQLANLKNDLDATLTYTVTTAGEYYFDVLEREYNTRMPSVTLDNEVIFSGSKNYLNETNSQYCVNYSDLKDGNALGKITIIGESKSQSYNVLRLKFDLMPGTHTIKLNTALKDSESYDQVRGLIAAVLVLNKAADTTSSLGTDESVNTKNLAYLLNSEDQAALSTAEAVEVSFKMTLGASVPGDTFIDIIGSAAPSNSPSNNTDATRYIRTKINKNWGQLDMVSASQKFSGVSDIEGKQKLNAAGKFTAGTETEYSLKFTIDFKNNTIIEESSSVNGSSTFEFTDFPTNIDREKLYLVAYNNWNGNFVEYTIDDIAVTIVKTEEPVVTEEPEETDAPSTEAVTLKYPASAITGGNSCSNTAEYIFVDGVDTNIASFFADPDDSTKIDADLVTGYKNYIVGTNSGYSHPSITATLPAGTYKMYYLGYNNDCVVNATFASTGTTVYDEAKGQQFAYQSDSTNRILKVYTLEFTLDSAVTDETITFDTATSGWLPDLYAVVITNQTAASEATPTPEPAVGAYSATWDFQTKNGAPTLQLQNAEDYNYLDTTGTHTLVIDTKTNGGKINNSSWTDWSQCNDGTTFEIPAYKGMKITWECMNGSTASVSVDGNSAIGEFVYTGDASTISVITKGFGYIRTISVAPSSVYEVSGTVKGFDAGVLEGSTITLTATSTQTYTATIDANNKISTTIPAGTYTASIDKQGYIVTSSSVTVTSTAIGDVEVALAAYQTVSGTIVNAPSEAFTLTFTDATGAASTVDLAAGATSYTTSLLSGTYAVTSSTGTLSPISSESFTVGTSAATKNLYYPEEIAKASSFNVTVGSNGEYKSITDALAGIAKLGTPTADNRATITLAAGETFREQVVVNVPYVTIKSDASNPAKITWYYGIGNTYYSMNENGWYDKDRAMTKVGKVATNPSSWGTTIQLNKDGIKLENLYIENSFNQYYTDEEFEDGVEPNGVANSGQNDRAALKKAGTAADSRTATERACALYFRTSKNEIYNCTIISSQDTIGTGGSAYFNDCTLIGNTDYICGGGDIVFDNCDLLFGGYSDKAVGGALTAANGTDAYVFRNCTIGNYQNEAGTRQHGTHTYGRDWGGVNAHVFFLNCDVASGTSIEKWGNMGGAVTAGTADLHVYDLSDPASYTSKGPSDKYNITAIDFETAAAKYENVIDMLSFTPEKITTAVTSTKALDGVADTETSDYVYGVMTTITAGTDAAVSGIKWVITDASGNAYERTTSAEVDNVETLNKGTFPTITGGGDAQVLMLFHADEGSYDVASIAE